jgi:hypothetical protein
LGKFRLLGNRLLWAVCLKIAEHNKRKKLCIYCDKNGSDNILSDFFHKLIWLPWTRLALATGQRIRIFFRANFLSRLMQGCQMVLKKNLSKFWRVLEWKRLAYSFAVWNIYYGRLVHFIGIWCMYIRAVWYILWPFGNLVKIWYIFPRFGILCR